MLLVTPLWLALRLVVAALRLRLRLRVRLCWQGFVMLLDVWRLRLGRARQWLGWMGLHRMRRLLRRTGCLEMRFGLARFRTLHLRLRARAFLRCGCGWPDRLGGARLRLLGLSGAMFLARRTAGHALVRQWASAHAGGRLRRQRRLRHSATLLAAALLRWHGAGLLAGPCGRARRHQRLR